MLLKRGDYRGGGDGYMGSFQFTDSSARRRTPKGTWDGVVMYWGLPGDVSKAQIEAGVAGAQVAYPAESLVHRIANELERLDPAAP